MDIDALETQLLYRTLDIAHGLHLQQRVEAGQTEKAAGGLRDHGSHLLLGNIQTIVFFW